MPPTQSPSEAPNPGDDVYSRELQTIGGASDNMRIPGAALHEAAAFKLLLYDVKLALQCKTCFEGRSIDAQWLKIAKIVDLQLKPLEGLRLFSNLLGGLGSAATGYVGYEQFLLKHPRDFSGAVQYGLVTGGVDYGAGAMLILGAAELCGPWCAIAGGVIYAGDTVQSWFTGKTYSGRIADAVFEGARQRAERESTSPFLSPTFP